MPTIEVFCFVFCFLLFLTQAQLDVYVSHIKLLPESGGSATSHVYQKNQETEKRNGFCLVFNRTGEVWGGEMFLSPHFSYSNVTVYKKEETKARKQVYIHMCRLSCEIT